MGDLTGKGQPDEKPVREVHLSGYFLGATEVTQDQWRGLMGTTTSFYQGHSLPVEQVNWHDAVAYCQKLTEHAQTRGLLPAGYVYRLPTEAQWEYACRAGTKGDYAGQLLRLAWYSVNADWQTQVVNRLSPNAWGFHQMHGNVSEWCMDNYDDHYDTKDTRDPAGPPNGDYRVIRGGNWSSPEKQCRSSDRAKFRPHLNDSSLGFRVALAPEERALHTSSKPQSTPDRQEESPNKRHVAPNHQNTAKPYSFKAPTRQVSKTLPAQNQAALKPNPETSRTENLVFLYQPVITRKDRYNSRGLRLADPVSILIQERWHSHRAGVAGEDYFNNPQRRSEIPSMIARGGSLSKTMRKVILEANDPVLWITVRKNPSGQLAMHVGMRSRDQENYSRIPSDNHSHKPRAAAQPSTQRMAFIDSESNFRTGPSTSTTVKYQPRVGTAGSVLRRQGNWVMIRLDNGDSGWVHKQNLRPTR